MSKKSVAKNYIYNLAYHILTIIIPLITTPYLARVLGAENTGIYGYTISINTYFILFGSLGVALYGQREIAFYQDNKEKRTLTFYEILIMRCITLGIALILFYIMFCLSGQYCVYYRILILEIIANMIDISWFFRGLEEFKKTVIRNTIVKIVSVLCIFIMVKKPSDLNMYFFIYVLSNLIGNFTLWLYLPKYLCKVSISQLKIFKHLKPTLMLFIPQIATQLYTVLDKTMIGTIVTDKSQVGFYEQAQKIVKLLLSIATSLGTVMMPRIAYTYAIGDKRKLKEYMDQSFKFITMLTFPLMFGIVSVASSFVPVFYGSGYDEVVLLINIISPIIVAIGFSNVIGTQYLLPTKQQKKYTISVTGGAVVNLVLNCILINIFQSIGASIATVIAEMSVTAIQFYLVREEIKFFDVLKKTYKYVIASGIMFIISFITGMFIKNNVISILIQVAVSGIVYFVALLMLKDKLIIDGINMVLKRKKTNKEETLNFLEDNIEQEDFNTNYSNNVIIKASENSDDISFKKEYSKLQNMMYPQDVLEYTDFMHYILEKDYNNIAYVDDNLISKEQLENILDYAFTLLYNKKKKNIKEDFTENVKNSNIAKNEYYKQCYCYIEKMKKGS